MHRIWVFLNDRASSSRSKDWRKELSQRLFRSEIEFLTPSSQEELRREVMRAASEKVDVVISVGGDGTVNQLIQALAGTSTALLVIPAGTANDFARELGTYGRISRAIDCVRKNEIEQIDLISVNGRYMATNGGVGIVSHVASLVNRLRSTIPGFKRVIMSRARHRIYSSALVGTLLTKTYPILNLKLRSPKHLSGETIKSPLLLVNNQPLIAGSFAIAPETKNNDGKFNVSVFSQEKWLELTSAILRVKRGLSLEHDPDFQSFETNEFEMESVNGEPLSFYGDGEDLAASPKLVFKIHPKALSVFKPSLEQLRQESGQAS